MATPQDLRDSFKVNDDIRDANLTTPEDITRVDDLAYGSDPMQVLDIYYPKGTDHPLPTIVSIHGGGYVYGDKERYQYYCMSLAQRGFTVVNFSYPLAPEHRFPEHLYNTNAAIAFAVAHAEQYHVDPDNLFIVGDSAGAQLNCQYSAAVTNPEYATLLDMKIPPITLRAIALNCGMYDRSALDEGDVSNWYLGPKEKRSELLLKQMDVLKYVTGNYPPSFVMSAVADFLLPAAAPMADFLTKQGVENELHIYGEAGVNDLSHVFHCDMRSVDAARCNDEECAFFKRHIKA